MQNKTSVSTLNYTDVKENEEHCNRNWPVAILPWGSVEPHGEHLPYATDTLLAVAVATGAIEKAQVSDKYKNKFMLLPALSLGVQNLGQVDKKFCLNFSPQTQYAVLKDIVNSLWKQNVFNLVIVNGHGGNDFKPVLRRLAVEYPVVKIFVCDYLTVINDRMRPNEGFYCVKFPKVDDHAAYTETSLMLHLFSDLVEMENIKRKDFTWEEEHAPIEKYSKLRLWHPRDFDEYSENNRIGSVQNACAEHGEKMYGFITDFLSDEIKKLV